MYSFNLFELGVNKFFRVKLFYIVSIILRSGHTIFKIRDVPHDLLREANYARANRLNSLINTLEHLSLLL